MTLYTVRAPKQPAGMFSKIDFICGLFSRECYFRERVIFPKPNFQVTNWQDYYWLLITVVAIFKSYQQLTKYRPAQLKSQGGKQENCQSRTAYEKLQSRELYEKLSIKFGAGYSGERVILIETLLALRVILERGLFSRAGCLGARTVCTSQSDYYKRVRRLVWFDKLKQWGEM